MRTYYQVHQVDLQPPQIAHVVQVSILT
jgi:hypothetical protein